MPAEDRYLVQLSESAGRDLAAICGYLEGSHSPELADKWLADFLAVIDSLEQFPERGAIPAELQAIGNRRYRQMLLLPYRIFYRVTGKAVVIMLIADGRRDLKSLLARRLLL